MPCPVNHLQCSNSQQILTPPAAIPPDVGTVSSKLLVPKHCARPLMADTVTIRLLLPTRQSRSWSDQSLKSCPTNRDKYTLPLFSFTPLFSHTPANPYAVARLAQRK